MPFWQGLVRFLGTYTTFIHVHIDVHLSFDDLIKAHASWIVTVYVVL